MTDTGGEGRRTDILVNEQGRVTIPAQIRREAGIEAGVPVVVYVDDGRVVIETRAQLVERLRRDVAGAWHGGDPVAELIAERRAEASREDTR